MKLLGRSLAIASLIAICIVGNTPSRADDEKDRDLRFNGCVANKLTSNVPGQAANTDRVLQNAWGVTFTPGNSPFWISDNATGCSTLYDGQGIPQPLPPTGPLSVKFRCQTAMSRPLASPPTPQKPA
jgi:hypothetical protein